MLNHGQRLKRRSNVRIKLVRLKHRDNVRKPSTLQQTRNFSSNMRRKIAP